ncbi:hypothetical protein [Rubripirellula reticaptiva]|uniref:hypothetical protein n=1 Tax=Rubripirellula reticaptiva TaxID=2528013 RepID=UPI001C93832D|nr:hypothetical protein [Rubripirellula reticaptiva]
MAPRPSVIYSAEQRLLFHIFLPEADLRFKAIYFAKVLVDGDRRKLDDWMSQFISRYDEIEED